MTDASLKITVLGSGSSSGVPQIGPDWGRCDPDHPRNRRRRASILVEKAETALLIDTSPDCREQLLSAEVGRLDAVVYTHAHADHCHGLDDLRWINIAMNASLDVYSDPKSFEEMRRRFGYAFDPLEESAGGYYYRPVLNWRELHSEQPIDGINVLTYPQDHGFSTTYGLRFGKFAYSTDLVRLDEHGFETLEGIDTWLVGGLREDEHPTHANLETVLGWIERLNPRRAIITHMNHTMDYATLKAQLPQGVEPAYDGMVLEI